MQRVVSLCRGSEEAQKFIKSRPSFQFDFYRASIQFIDRMRWIIKDESGAARRVRQRFISSSEMWNSGTSRGAWSELTYLYRRQNQVKFTGPYRATTYYLSL